MKEFDGDATASTEESQNINLRSLPPEPALLTTKLYQLPERGNSKSLATRRDTSYILHEKIMNMRIQKMIDAK